MLIYQKQRNSNKNSNLKVENIMIQLKNLKKEFKTKDGNVTALSDINFTINEGEIFGIIGKSGAGKSTLVRCINLLEVPTGGEVICDGTVLTSLSKKELRQQQSKIGMIFQQFNLFEQRDVLSNVCFPLEITGVDKATAIKQATDMLNMVGLQDKLRAYPSQLSGGQKQRVAIARALVNKPKVLLCDEATSALDVTTRNSILNLLKELNSKLNITIVIITHEIAVVKHMCERVAILNSGTVLDIGNTKEIFEKNHAITALNPFDEDESSVEIAI